jgi:uncharacterized protein YegJ (DUF2314 family)
MRRGRLVALVMAAACSRGRAPAQVIRTPAADAGPAARAASGDLRAERTAFSLGITFLPESKVPVDAAIARCSGKMTDPASVNHATMPLEPGDAPDEDYFARFGYGLTPEQVAAARRATKALRLDFTAARADMDRTLRESAALALCLAHETGGVVWDDVTREIFGEDAWREQRIAGKSGDVRDHIVVHAYADGDLDRSVTLGMRKLGLPDLVVNGHARSQQQDMTVVIDIVAQTLWKRGGPARDGTLAVSAEALFGPDDVAAIKAKGGRAATRVHLVEGTREEGDDENRLLEIRFAGPEQQIDAIRELFGLGDKAMMAKEADPELEAARTRAMAKLRALRPKFAKGVPELARLLVKAPFTTASGGVEWMWVEVQSWKGDELVGLLMNEPYEVPGLKQGTRVRVKQDSLFDYMYEHDGRREGDETTQILERRERRGKP